MLKNAAQPRSEWELDKRLLPFLFLCIGMLLAVPAPAVELTIQAPGHSSEPAVEDLLRKGIALYAAGNLAGADAGWARVREKYPAHPGPLIFEIKTLQARRSLDWWNEQYNAPIRERAEEAAALARVWMEREPGSARARLYLGQALLELMVIKGISGHYYSAGVDGVAAGKHLERALEIDPELIDAKVPLGTLRYYAAIAGKYVKIVSWLWFVPKGDRELGLAYLEQARKDADLFRFDAELTLSSAYMYIEEEPERAQPVLLEMVARNPSNSLLHFEIVELRLQEGNYLGTIAATDALEEAIGSQFGDSQRRSMARIWRARAELHLGRAERTRRRSWHRPRRTGRTSRRGAVAGCCSRKRTCSIWPANASWPSRSTKQVVHENARSSRSVALAREGLDAPFHLENVSPAVATGPDG